MNDVILISEWKRAHEPVVAALGADDFIAFWSGWMALCGNYLLLLSKVVNNGAVRPD